MDAFEEEPDSSPQTSSTRRISPSRRLAYVLVIYLLFLLILLSVEVGTRLLMAHLSSLELFVSTPQQIAQVGTTQQSVIFEGDPLLLWRLKPNLDRAVWDFTVISTNAQGLRSSYLVTAKEPGAVRVVCLGDSVTFGYRVPVVWPDKPADYDPEWLPYPMLLEKVLRAANPEKKIEVIAMAVPGYTTHQGLAWLRRDIDSLKPDLLIISFGWNDVSFSDIPDREAIRTNSSAVAIRWLIDHSQALAHATKWLRSGKESNRRAQAIRPVPRVDEQEYLNNILAMVQLAHEHSAGVIVLAAPYRDNVTNPSEARLMIRYRTALRVAMEQNHVSYLEIPELTEIAYPSNKGWFGELIHPNHMGHRLIASELLKLLQSNQLLKGITIPTLIP
jgi:lysophospholipase L1-like esterase